MQNQSLDEFLLKEIGQSVALQWIEDVIRAAGKYKKRGFNAELAGATGFSLSYVGKVLSAKSKVTVAFLVAFGKAMGLTEQEMKAKLFNFEIDLEQTLTQIANEDTSELVDLLENKPKPVAEPIGVMTSARKLAGVDLPEDKSKTVAQVGIPEMLAYSVAGIPYPKIAGITGNEMLGADEYLMILKDILGKIGLYFTSIDMTGILGQAAESNFANMTLLPPHEIIDLMYQFRKLRDGDSDRMAAAAADEKLASYGIKRGGTRLKLERIPVEPNEEKQEK